MNGSIAALLTSGAVNLLLHFVTPRVRKLSMPESASFRLSDLIEWARVGGDNKGLNW
jgi:hypothetical protein